MTSSRIAEPVEGSSATARLVSIALAITLGVSLLFEARTGSSEGFAAAGASRRLVLPLVYAFFGLVLLRGLRDHRGVMGPMWMWFPLLGVTASLVFNIDDLLRHGLLINVAQGLLLFAGFTLIGLAGCLTGRWSTRDRRFLMYVLIGVSLCAVLLPKPSLALLPYAALAIPALFCALLLGVTAERFRWLWLGACVVIVVLGFPALRPAPGFPIGIATLGQIAVGVGVVLILLLPRRLRATALVVASVALVVVLFTPTVQDFLTGHYVGDDVTLAHRAYEAEQVEETVIATPVGLVVGRGPAATVDLTRSPDRETLLFSGRDLSAVDDVHLITAYLLLKLGFVGLAWLIWLLVVTFRILWAVMCAPRIDVWRVCLLIFVLCGLVAAFPAATELLSNPLVPLFLGILWAEGVAPRPGSVASSATRTALARAE